MFQAVRRAWPGLGWRFGFGFFGRILELHLSRNYARERLGRMLRHLDGLLGFVMRDIRFTGDFGPDPVSICFR
jgi:hypothetical protein